MAAYSICAMPLQLSRGVLRTICVRIFLCKGCLDLVANRLSTTASFRVALALIMVVAGALHFVATDAYIAIMPSYLPLHRELVYLSGALEIVFGLGLLWWKTRSAAGSCLILLYLAVLPANINMAVEDIQPASFQIPTSLLWARIPLQLVFIYWAWWVSRPEAPRDPFRGPS